MTAFLFFLEEDNDLSKRIFKKGYDLAVNSKIEFFHITGNCRNLYERYRAKNYLIIKNYGIYFKFKYFYSLIKYIFISKNSKQFKTSIIKLTYFVYFLLLFPIIFIRRYLNYIDPRKKKY